MSTSRSSPATLLAELVELPSVHPDGDPGGTVAGEAQVAAWLAGRLRRLGAEVEMPLLAPHRPMVVATFEPAGRPTATVALVPHLDTVGVAGMTVPPFRLTVRGDRLHGRGTCDTKGPLAALLWAFERWSRMPSHARGSTRWIFAATAGEEQGSLGAQLLVKRGFRCDFAIALEPTRLRVVNAAKGVLRMWIQSRGRAAHGSTPDRGINAIERLLPFAQAVARELRPQLAAHRHPLLGPATVNLGVFQGGTELNIVPDACRLGLDIRTHPGFGEAAAVALVEQTRRRHAAFGRVEVVRQAPAFVTSKREPWAVRLRKCGRGWDQADWFCDANIFAAAGIPSVAFGPGRIAQAHTHNEFIERGELTSGANAFLQLLRSQ